MSFSVLRIIFARSGADKYVMECPKCKSHNIRRSIRRGPKEGIVLRMLLLAPYRCLNCGNRFWARSNNPPFQRRKKHRTLAAYFGFRKAEKKRYVRMGIILSVGLMLIIAATYLVFRLVEPTQPSPTMP
jgi:hypothetical protein